MTAHSIGTVNRFLKDYCFAAREIIGQRDFISHEYYRAKLQMNEKKAVRLGMEPKFWELDQDLIKLNDLSTQQVEANPDISRRFIYAGVS